MLRHVNILETYKAAGAYLEGHYLLASGRHAPLFLQSTTVMQQPRHTEYIGQAMAELLSAKLERKPDFVIGPAMGGVVLAYEVARHLGCRALFAEKDGEGGMLVREAFDVEGNSFVAVEDVITTGGSLKKGIAAAEKRGATLLESAVIIDRRSNELREDWSLASLLHLPLETYDPETCPLCAQGILLEDV